jgi:F0F1-type ATP synthase alpha subunit
MPQQHIEYHGNFMELTRDDSDGIARVHGMNNVQAEELVEYARPATSLQQAKANGMADSLLVSRACA